MKKLSLIAIVLCIGLLMCSCKNTGNPNDTNNKPSNIVSRNEDGKLSFDINPADKEQVASDTADYKPDDGYTFEKSPTTIAPDNVNVDGFDLKNNESKDIANVCYERDEINRISIDIMTKGASDIDLKNAVDMTRSIITSVYSNFPFDELDGQIPLSVATIKQMIAAGESASDITYSQDYTQSISHDYSSESGILIFLIEFE